MYFPIWQKLLTRPLEIVHFLEIKCTGYVSIAGVVFTFKFLWILLYANDFSWYIHNNYFRGWDTLGIEQFLQETFLQPVEYLLCQDQPSDIHMNVEIDLRNLNTGKLVTLSQILPPLREITFFTEYLYFIENTFVPVQSHVHELWL